MSRNCWYKRGKLKSTYLYVRILVPLVILNYILWYINDIQYSLLYHTTNMNIYIQIIDLEWFITTMSELWLFILHEIQMFIWIHIQHLIYLFPLWTLFLYTRKSIIYCKQLCYHIWTLTTLQSLLPRLKL